MADRGEPQLECARQPKGKAFPEKVVYFADPMLTFGCQSIEQEYKENVELKLKLHSIKFTDIRCTTDPPFAGARKHRDMGHYDILFFDWGGMGVVDQRMMSDYCRLMLRDATENPSRFYVVTSAFTEAAMKDAMANFADAVPGNMFLSLTDFIKYYLACAGHRAKCHDTGDDARRKLHLVQKICFGKERR